MSTASITRTGRPVAIIRGGGAPHIRNRAAHLLSQSGFAITANVAAHAGLVVVVCTGGDTERVREVREAAEAHPDVHVLAILPAGAPNASLRRTLLAGASGIVFDDQLDPAVAPSARAMLAGQLVVPLVLSQQIAPRPLSHREKQILGLVVLGLTNREIADKLYLAESTVKTHLSSAFRKLDARSRSEAVARIQDPESGYGMAILAIAEDLAASAA
jgi:DNA-binding NarL/FixJ family response regulator